VSYRKGSNENITSDAKAQQISDPTVPLASTYSYFGRFVTGLSSFAVVGWELVMNKLTVNDSTSSSR
jgi:hypothetical protein